ncbi:MAG: outer membrane beta-barrel protein [Alphaproteobacteria bacterium]|nr:outer membrane beta-barrel protein [Alphaproteobacteria bacterium]
MPILPKKLLLKSVSILALSFFTPFIFSAPVLAQNYSASNIDPYGYGTVPLPPPQPQSMMMPSFQAQQGYAPLNQYSGQYGSQYGSQGAVSYGQATPHPVTTAQYGVVPTYLPATRISSYGTTTPQASSVGYVVNGGQAGAQPQPYGAAPNAQQTPYSQSMTAPAGSGYVQTQAYAYGGQAPTASAPNYSAGYQAPSVSVQPPSYQPPSMTTPAVTAQVPVTTYPSPTYSAPAGSITASPTYDGTSSTQSSYQVASNAPVSAPSYTAPNYGYQSPADAQPQYAQVPVGQDAAQQSQAQAYTYASQQPAQGYAPQGYTTQTQIYSPSTAFAVQQDSYPQPTASAASTRSGDASMAFDPTTSSPWYLAIRSGLTIPQGTSFNFGGSKVEQEFETGWQLGTAAGYEFKSFNSWLAPRAEIELTYDQALVDSHKIGATKFTDPAAYGFVRSLDLMANGYLDFRANRYLSPYLGGGIGLGYSDFDRLGTGPTGVVMDDNDVGFVWQMMAGLGINLSNSSMVDFGYRYQQNTGLTLKAGDGTSTTTDLSKHVIMIGFRNNL